MLSVRSFGYSWLIPLGRLNTQEEDQESSFTPSPPPQRLPSPLLQPQQALPQQNNNLPERNLDDDVQDLDSFGEDDEEEDQSEQEDNHQDGEGSGED